MSSVWLLPSTSTWPNKVLKGSSNYEQYLKRLYQKCHLLNFTMGPNVLEPSGHTLGSWLNMEGVRAVLKNHLTLCLLGARIIGWGIRFKLQMLCPQEDK